MALNEITKCFAYVYFNLFYMSPTLKLDTSYSVWYQSQKSFLPYLICFLHITDFATCCWVESCKRLSLAGPDPFVVNEKLWTWRCLVEWSVTQPLTPSPGRLPWCIWYLALGQAEEEATAGSPHWSRSLFFHSVPFWGGSRSSRVCPLVSVCSVYLFSALL